MLSTMLYFVNTETVLKWVHRRCAKLTKRELEELSASSSLYFCPKCKDVLPYSGLNDDELQCEVQDISENIYELYEQCDKLNFKPFVCSDTSYYFDDKIDPDKEFFNNININCEYFTQTSFSKNVTKINGFSIIHFNCRSIRKNFSAMVDVIQSMKYDFDVIAVSETWEVSNDCSDKYLIDGYESSFMSRTHKGGGGVAIFSRIGLHAKVISSGSFSVNDIVDCLSIEIETKQKKIVVCCVYRPPNRNISDFISQMELLLQRYRNRTLFLVGDININILNYSSHNDTNAFLNLMYGNGLYPLITKPTRIARNNATLIDNIFTNEIQCITKSGVYICDVSDYLPVFQVCNYGECKNKDEDNKFVFKRCLDENSVNRFIEAVSNTSWNEVIQELDPSVSYDKFITILCTLYDEHCPMKKVKTGRKRCSKPWLTPGLINATKKKRWLFEQSLKYGTIESEINIRNIEIN